MLVVGVPVDYMRLPASIMLYALLFLHNHWLYLINEKLWNVF